MIKIDRIIHKKTIVKKQLLQNVRARAERVLKKYMLIRASKDLYTIIKVNRAYCILAANYVIAHVINYDLYHIFFSKVICNSIVICFIY